ncbi:MAG: translation initiation factor IF-2 [Culicoidibacterales bacterium]
MGKIRMVELAKQKQLKVADLVVLAKKMDMDVKNAMSSVTEQQAESLVQKMSQVEKEPKKSVVLAEKVPSEQPTVAKKVEAVVEKPVVESKKVEPVAAKQEVVEPVQPKIEIGKNASQYSNRRVNDRENNQMQHRGNTNGTHNNNNITNSYQTRNENQTRTIAPAAATAPTTGAVKTTASGNAYQERNANPSANNTSGGFQNRNASQGTSNAGGGFQNRNASQGGYNNNNNSGGGFQNRNTGQGGYNNNNNSGSGFQNRNAGQGTSNTNGGFQNRNTGQGTGNTGGGFQNRNTGQGTGNTSGGFQNRNTGQGTGNTSGGFQNRNAGQGTGNTGGGFQNRNTGQGGYNNNNSGGGFQNRNTGQGGYNNNNSGGGFQNRNTGQGGYNNNNSGGGFQNRNTGQGGQGGGFQNRNTGQGGQGGGFQNRGGYNNNSGGGFQNRGSGMDTRNIDKKLSDISAAVPADTAVKTTRTSFIENKDRRNVGDERKSKKQLKEEKRLEDKKMYERNRGRGRGRGPKPVIIKPDLPKFIKHKGSLTVGELSQQIGITVAEIIKYLLGLDIMATINHSLDADTIELIAAEYNATIEYEETVDETDLSLYFESEDTEDNMEARPPVITIMGHVDHGKTTLLDAIRKTEVVEGEAGGITQHIGAYQITHEGKQLTFLDTPGHEAFTSMRARGAQITDIAIIVVAADDGVMPQTKEAVEHAKAAAVPIIVAVNKIDKPGADATRVMQGLTELGLQPEAWGGSTIFVEISAKMGTGLDNLIEMILLVSEVQELKANPNRHAFGTVVEARLDKGRGSVATLLVQGGTLKIGDPIVVGSAYGRVRTMEDDFGKRLKVAGPSMPVELTGLIGVPSAGDHFAVFETEKKARQVGATRAASFVHEQRRKSAAMNLEDLNQQILEGEIKEINIIVKGDVQGSVEAVSQSFAKIEVSGVRVKIVRAAVGAITESDVMLALASNAIIYGFNVRPDANTRQAADREGVSIRLHAIIYKAIEEIEAAMTGMLDPEFEEVVTGQASIRALFKVSKIGTIAGCMVTEGLIKRDNLVRIIRDGITIYDGKLGSLKREQDDAKSVSAGYECGITIDGYNDLREGDIFEGYEMQEIKPKKK